VLFKDAGPAMAKIFPKTIFGGLLATIHKKITCLLK
jgi:hypothetical protein